MRLLRYTIILLFTLAINSGCQSEESMDGLSSRQTLIVYMGGDNNLSIETFEKLAVIQSFARNNPRIKTGEVNVLMYQDTKEETKLYKGRYGTDEAELLATYSHENSASSEVFGRVLRDCMQLAPAQSYGLILFSHASGWLPEGTLLHPSRVNVSSRSLIVDGTSEMDIKDFAQAIPNGTFDYIVFEACFMAGVEVAYELKDKTKYIVGSSAEMLSPGFTDFYPGILNELCHPLISVETKLVNLANIYFDHYNRKQGQNRSATISVIRTEGLNRLSEAVKRGSLGANVNVRRIQHFDRYQYRLFFDLGDYAEQTNTRGSAEIMSCIDDVMVLRLSTPTFLPAFHGFAIKRHSGLTIYVEQEEFPYLNQKYKELKWSKSLN